MAKLFKTISLEDRLRGSSYNELPHAPNPVNQGSIDLKQVDKGEKLPTAQLKLTPRRDEANSQILKLTLVDRLTKSIEPLKVMSTKPISQIARPFVNTKFRSAISLENRLKQTTLGSTAHLPQFFLSDIFTDYITIKPFGVFNHTSNIVLTQPTTLINPFYLLSHHLLHQTFLLKQLLNQLMLVLLLLMLLMLQLLVMLPYLIIPLTLIHLLFLL